jgi:hypothetical protein
MLQRGGIEQQLVRDSVIELPMSLWPTLSTRSAEHSPVLVGMPPVNRMQERSSMAKDDGEPKQKEDGLPQCH